MKRFFSRGNYHAVGTLTSTAIASGTNAVFVIAVSLVLEASQYGLFAISILYAQIIAGLLNHSLGEVFLTRGRKDLPEQVVAAAVVVSLSVLALGLVSAVLFTVLWASSGATVGAVVGVSVAVAPVTMHATLRLVAFGKREPMRAVRLDAEWLLALTVGFVVVLVSGADASAIGMVWLWAGAALAAVLSDGLRSGAWKAIVNLGIARAWFAQQRRFGAGLTLGSAMDAGSRLMVPGLVAGSVSLYAVGGMRLAETIFGVGTIVFVATRNWYLPRSRWEEAGLLRKLFFVSVILTAVPLGTLLALRALMAAVPSLGTLETWSQAAPLFLPIAVASIAAALRQGAIMAFRLRSTSTGFVLGNIAQAIVLVVAAFIGVSSGEIVVIMWWIAGGQLFATLVWWLLVLNGIRKGRERAY